MLRGRHLRSALVIFAAGCVPASRRTPFPVVASETPVYEWRNGRWYNGTTFDEGTRYTVYSVVTSRRPEPVDSVIDLRGAYVVAGTVDSGIVRVRRRMTLDDGHDASFFVVLEKPALDAVNAKSIALLVRKGRIVPATHTARP